MMKATPAQRLQLFDPIVKARLQKTFAYFGGACMGTGGFMFALRNSSLVSMNPWMLLACSLGTLVGTHMLDYDT